MSRNPEIAPIMVNIITAHIFAHNNAVAPVMNIFP